jgi:hypothetical protein
MAIPMMVRVMPIVVVIAPTIGPIRIAPIIRIGIPRIAPVGVGVPRVAPIRIPTPIGSPIRTVTPADVDAGIIIPIEGVVAVHIDVCVAATSIIIVIIISCRRSLCAKTLDASGKVGIVIGLRGSVYNAVGVGHCFCGLINGIGIVNVVLAVGIIGLVVVFRIAADAWTHVRTVACSHSIARVAIG